MVIADEKETFQDQSQLVEALKGWHRSKEASSRHNRNLLQYGAMIAGALGIEAGSGGVIAIANAVGGLPWWGPLQFVATAVVTAVIGVSGAVMALRSYRLRYEAEQEVEQYSSRLIELCPEHFLPNSESLRGS